MVIDLYVDGSYSKNKPNETAGAAIIVYNGKVVLSQRYTTTKPDYTKMNNVGGELIAAAQGMTLVVAFMNLVKAGNVPFVLNVYHDYKGIYEFAKKINPWQAKSPGAQKYVSMVRALERNYPDMKINFIKVKSHTGNKWNEVVDRVAAGYKPVECEGTYVPEMVI